ncbi:MAG: hypothetical protein ACXAAH_13790 [Promethearchaeota archaeon]
MPYLVVFTCWPSDKIPEMVKKAIEVAQKFPPDDSLGEQVVPNAINGKLDGMKSLAVTLVKEGKLEETIARAGQIVNIYATIPGFEYSIEVWSTPLEAYAAIGQTPPE